MLITKDCMEFIEHVGGFKSFCNSLNSYKDNIFLFKQYVLKNKLPLCRLINKTEYHELLNKYNIIYDDGSKNMWYSLMYITGGRDNFMKITGFSLLQCRRISNNLKALGYRVKDFEIAIQKLLEVYPDDKRVNELNLIYKERFINDND
jgi:hypothetical protein